MVVRDNNEHRAYLKTELKPQMKDQQHVFNQQFAFFLTFSFDMDPFINCIRWGMSDGATMLNKIILAFDRMDFGH